MAVLEVGRGLIFANLFPLWCVFASHLHLQQACWHVNVLCYVPDCDVHCRQHEYIGMHAERVNPGLAVIQQMPAAVEDLLGLLPQTNCPIQQRHTAGVSAACVGYNCISRMMQRDDATVTVMLSSGLAGTSTEI